MEHTAAGAAWEAAQIAQGSARPARRKQLSLTCAPKQATHGLGSHARSQSLVLRGWNEGRALIRKIPWVGNYFPETAGAVWKPWH